MTAMQTDVTPLAATSTPYFTSDDHALLSHSSHNLSGTLLLDKLRALHGSLHGRIRDHQWNLFPHWDTTALYSNRSASSAQPINGLTLTYLRSREQAATIERMTGREAVGSRYPMEGHRHPTVEIRLTPEHLAVELVVSPAAWWDQRNLIGKLTVPRHREALATLMSRMGGDFRLGFWEGSHLSDSHMTVRQMLRGGLLMDWLSTFGDGQDWLRVGVWYPVADTQVLPTTDSILAEVFARMQALYQLYTFIVWTSNNNFHNFYTGSLPPGNSRAMRSAHRN